MTRTLDPSKLLGFDAEGTPLYDIVTPGQKAADGRATGNGKTDGVIKAVGGGKAGGVIRAVGTPKTVGTDKAQGFGKQTITPVDLSKTVGADKVPGAVMVGAPKIGR